VAALCASEQVSSSNRILLGHKLAQIHRRKRRASEVFAVRDQQLGQIETQFRGEIARRMNSPAGTLRENTLKRVSTRFFFQPSNSFDDAPQSQLVSLITSEASRTCPNPPLETARD
jgi:hypothetical protein